MIRLFPVALLLGLSVAPLHAETGSLRRDDPQLREQAARTFIVRFADSVPRAEVPNRAREVANRVGGSIRHVYQHTIKGVAVEAEPTVIAQFLTVGLDVISVEPDAVVYITANASAVAASSLADQANDLGEVTPWGVKRVGGGMTPALEGRVFVIDTGIANHPDLIIDREMGYPTNDNEDGNGHGTHVAGTIAALGGNDANGDTAGHGGVVGVAPGATVVPVRVLDENGGGTISGVVAGIDYVARRRAECGLPTATQDCPPEKWVANMSLGGWANSTLDAAVVRAADTGVRFAIAAGNDRLSATRFSPARVEAKNVLTVSASDSSDALASFSNFGNPPVDFAAPGVTVLSTVPGGYATYNGTSMAAPHVAGLMVLNPLLDATTTDKSFCGTLKSDRDKTPDRIAFNGMPTSDACKALIGTSTGGGGKPGGKTR